MKTQNFFIALAVCASILAMITAQNKSQLQSTSELNNTVDLNQIKYDLENLKSKVDRQANQVSNLTFRETILEQKYSGASFTATDSSYRIINTGIGNVLVALRNVEKMGDGYKLFFQIGNPNSMTLSGLKGKISWRPTVDYKKYYADSKYSAEIDERLTKKTLMSYRM